MGGGGGGFDSKRAGAKGLAFGRGAVFVAVLRGGAKPLLPPFVDVGSWNLAMFSSGVRSSAARRSVNSPACARNDAARQRVCYVASVSSAPAIVASARRLAAARPIAH